MWAAAIASASWPGLARPSTTCGAEYGKVMDGRHKAGHDMVGAIPPHFHHFNANAGLSEPSISSTCAATDGPNKPGHDNKETTLLRQSAYPDTHKACPD